MQPQRSSYTYTIDIYAPREKVWTAMTEHGLYEKWADAFSPESTFEGEWKINEIISFKDGDGHTTNARLTIFKPYETIFLEHVYVAHDGEIVPEENLDDNARKWIGSTEEYRFVEKENATEVIITLITHPDFKNMFDALWNDALKKLKEVCENK